MATYKQIQGYVKENYGYAPKTCWIAHVKEICGLNPPNAPNRFSANKRTNPCPLEKQADLRNALEHFGVI
ncbi:MAG: 23S rRNA methyltransferase [Clostridiales bacterium]|nr:23S rRNA methyltransferase [Clostridiales bacterium]